MLYLKHFQLLTHTIWFHQLTFSSTCVRTLIVLFISVHSLNNHQIDLCYKLLTYEPKAKRQLDIYPYKKGLKYRDIQNTIVIKKLLVKTWTILFETTFTMI